MRYFILMVLMAVGMAGAATIKYTAPGNMAVTSSRTSTAYNVSEQTYPAGSTIATVASGIPRTMTVTHASMPSIIDYSSSEFSPAFYYGGKVWGTCGSASTIYTTEAGKVFDAYVNLASLTLTDHVAGGTTNWSTLQSAVKSKANGALTMTIMGMVNYLGHTIAFVGAEAAAVDAGGEFGGYILYENTTNDWWVVMKSTTGPWIFTPGVYSDLILNGSYSQDTTSTAGADLYASKDGIDWYRVFNVPYASSYYTHYHYHLRSGNKLFVAIGDNLVNGGVYQLTVPDNWTPTGTKDATTGWGDNAANYFTADTSIYSGGRIYTKLVGPFSQYTGTELFSGSHNDGGFEPWCIGLRTDSATTNYYLPSLWRFGGTGNGDGDSYGNYGPATSRYVNGMRHTNTLGSFYSSGTYYLSTNTSQSGTYDAVWNDGFYGLYAAQNPANQFASVIRGIAWKGMRNPNFVGDNMITFRGAGTDGLYRYFAVTPIQTKTVQAYYVEGAGKNLHRDSIGSFDLSVISARIVKDPTNAYDILTGTRCTPSIVNGGLFGDKCVKLVIDTDGYNSAYFNINVNTFGTQAVTARTIGKPVTISFWARQDSTTPMSLQVYSDEIYDGVLQSKLNINACDSAHNTVIEHNKFYVSNNWRRFWLDARVVATSSHSIQVSFAFPSITAGTATAAQMAAYPIYIDGIEYYENQDGEFRLNTQTNFTNLGLSEYQTATIPTGGVDQTCTVTGSWWPLEGGDDFRYEGTSPTKYLPVVTLWASISDYCMLAWNKQTRKYCTYNGTTEVAITPTTVQSTKQVVSFTPSQILSASGEDDTGDVWTIQASDGVNTNSISVTSTAETVKGVVEGLVAAAASAKGASTAPWTTITAYEDDNCVTLVSDVGASITYTATATGNEVLTQSIVEAANGGNFLPYDEIQFALVHEPGQVKFYIYQPTNYLNESGVMVVSATGTNSLTGTPSKLILGSNADGTQIGCGAVGNIRLSDDRLSLNEIYQVFQATTGLGAGANLPVDTGNRTGAIYNGGIYGN